MSFDVKSELLATIAKTDDQVQRSMLMLMLGVLERVENLLEDEQALQVKVLNGLVGQHKEDHAFVQTMRSQYSQTVCDWAKKKMAEEEVAGGQWRKRFGDLLFDLAKGALMFILGAAAYAFMAGFPLLNKVAG